jgi:hypothetical protein
LAKTRKKSCGFFFFRKKKKKKKKNMSLFEGYKNALADGDIDFVRNRCKLSSSTECRALLKSYRTAQSEYRVSKSSNRCASLSSLLAAQLDKKLVEWRLQIELRFTVASGDPPPKRERNELLQYLDGVSYMLDADGSSGFRRYLNQLVSRYGDTFPKTLRAIFRRSDLTIPRELRRECRGGDASSMNAGGAAGYHINDDDERVDDILERLQRAMDEKRRIEAAKVEAEEKQKEKEDVDDGARPKPRRSGRNGDGSDHDEQSDDDVDVHRSDDGSSMTDDTTSLSSSSTDDDAALLLAASSPRATQVRLTSHAVSPHMLNYFTAHMNESRQEMVIKSQQRGVRQVRVRRRRRVRREDKSAEQRQQQ